MGQKGFYSRQKETFITKVVDVFSDLMTTVLFTSYFSMLPFDHNKPDGVFPTVCFDYIYLICMFVYISDGVWHFAQLCPRQGEYIFVDCPQCNIQMKRWGAFIVKHVVRVWLSHRVRETGSLCEHESNVLLCNGKIAADLLSLLIVWCCMCWRGRSGREWSSQILSNNAWRVYRV